MIAIAATERIIKATEHTPLIGNCGHIWLTLSWAYSVLKRMHTFLAAEGYHLISFKARVELAKKLT